MTHYTRPERCTARAQCREVADRVKQHGGCAHCVHRDRTFHTGQRAACGKREPLAFPACLQDEGGFEFDESTLQGH